MLEEHCSNCIHHSSDRGFCWSEDRGADPTDRNGAVFSEISQSTELEGRTEDEVCEHWVSYPESIREA